MESGIAGEKVSNARPFVGVVYLSRHTSIGITSGRTAITLFESFSERSFIEIRFEFVGGSIKGGRIDRQSALGKDVF